MIVAPFYFGSCAFTPARAGLIALFGQKLLSGIAYLQREQRDVE